MSWDYIMKFVIAGEASVGKTSLLYRLTDERFLSTPDPTIGVEFGSKLLRVQPPSSLLSPSYSAAQPTSGEEPISSTEPTAPSAAAPEEGDDEEDAKWVKLQCWDVAGSPSFRAITRSYYRGSAGAILVYDVNRRETFEQIPNWLADIRAHADPEVSVILIGNKADLDPIPPPSPSSPDSISPSAQSSSRVPTSEGQAYADKESLLFLETSAKTGLNVNRAFDETARAILGKILQGSMDAKEKGKTGKGGIRLSGEGGQAKRTGCC